MRTTVAAGARHTWFPVTPLYLTFIHNLQSANLLTFCVETKSWIQNPLSGQQLYGSFGEHIWDHTF